MNIDGHRDAEDILSEALAFLGGKPVVDENLVHYGPLSLRIAPKEGKANTLLADHLFSPALYLAERIERGLLSGHGATVIELGSGSGLPSLLMATQPEHPSLVVVTDYPDQHILGNLSQNVESNRPKFQSSCRIQCMGYEWGTETENLLKMLPHHSSGKPPGFDIVILSDLLHFHDSHEVLLSSISSLLSRSKHSRVHVSAGKYTQRHICDNFLANGQNAGLSFEEILPDAEEIIWEGDMEVGGLDKEDLALRKANCYYWVGRWADS